MSWSSENHASAVDAYFLNGYSVIATQRAFRNRFNLAPLTLVPDRKSIVTWLTTFNQAVSVTKQITGVPWPIRSPKSIETVRASSLRSLWPAAPKRASAVGLSVRFVRRIVHEVYISILIRWRLCRNILDLVSILGWTHVKFFPSFLKTLLSFLVMKISEAEGQPGHWSSSCLICRGEVHWFWE